MGAAKRKGTRNEHRSRAVLEAAGYVVTRAAGPRPGGTWSASVPRGRWSAR
jgi:hypothetical protein